jgi:hypothetical protein
VADRLVDGQPQVAGVDDQVVAAGPDAGGGQLPGEQAGHLCQLGGEVPGRGARSGPRAAPQVFQPAPGRWGQRAHGLEPAAGLDRDRGHHRVKPHPLLERGGGPVGVELALPDLVQRGVRVIDPVVGEQAGAPACEQGDLVGDADLQRVHPVGGHPADIAVGRLVGELNAFGINSGRHPRHLDRLLGGAQRGRLGQVDRGREPPGAIEHDPHRQPQIVAVEEGHQLAVGQPDLLLPDAFGAEVRVLCAKVGGALQSRRGELVQGVGGELGVDLPGAVAGVVVTGVVAGGSVARGSVRSAVSHESQPIPRPGRRIRRRHPG